MRTCAQARERTIHDIVRQRERIEVGQGFGWGETEQRELADTRHLLRGSLGPLSRAGAGAAFPPSYLRLGPL